MTLRRLLTALLPIGLLLLPGLADAEIEYDEPTTPGDFGRPGIYLLVGGGGATKFIDDTNAVLSVASDILSDGATIGTRAGARVNRFVAVEGAFDYLLAGFNANFTAAAPCNVGCKLENEGFTVTGNLKLFPFAGRVQPYAVGGLGYMWLQSELLVSGVTFASQTSGAFVGRVGGGIDIYVNEVFFISPEVTYMMPTGDLAGLNFLTWGGYIGLRF